MVDYIKDDIVYEIKSRTKKLYRRLYDSEKMQIQMYLYLSDLKTGTLVETFGSESNEIQVLCDPEYINIVIEVLKYYCTLVKKFI